MRRALGVLLAAGAAGLGACEGAGDREVQRADTGTVRRPVTDPLPDAFLVRFEEVKGAGSSRESWEIEVLQMGGDVRVRGSVRVAGSSLPVFHAMTGQEFTRFWEWIRRFPLDGFRVEEDRSAPEGEWRKRLTFDVVTGPDRRLLSDNEWRRPVVGAPWLAEVEDHLHLMLLDYAEEELRRGREQPRGSTAVDKTVKRAREALGDAEPSNLPGGSPDVD